MCISTTVFLQQSHLTRYINCGLRILRECRERFPRHRLQRNPLVSDLSMHYGTCVTHVPWYMTGSLTRGGGENVPGIPGACATSNFTYLARGPCSPCIRNHWQYSSVAHFEFSVDPRLLFPGRLWHSIFCTTFLLNTVTSMYRISFVVVRITRSKWMYTIRIV